MLTFVVVSVLKWSQFKELIDQMKREEGVTYHLRE